MDFDFQENGEFLAASLNDFRIVNELGMGVYLQTRISGYWRYSASLWMTCQALTTAAMS
jgi:hypothetical protein